MDTRKKAQRDFSELLNRVTDDIYAEAAKIWDWETSHEREQWAAAAGLHPNTIWYLGTRETKNPQFLTIFKLARSVGWKVQLDHGTVKVKKRVA